MQITFDENSYENVRHLSKTGKSTLISSLSLLKADDLCLLFRLIFLFNRQTGLSPVENNGIVSVPAQEKQALFQGIQHKHCPFPLSDPEQA